MRAIGRHSLYKPGDEQYQFDKGGEPKSVEEIRSRLTQIGTSDTQDPSEYEGPKSRGMFTSGYPESPQKIQPSNADGEPGVLEKLETRGVDTAVDENKRAHEEKRKPEDSLVVDHASSTSESNLGKTPVAITVDASGLKRLHSSKSFIGYLREVWNRRYFIWTDARYKAFRTTRDYRLWRFWLVAQPLLDAAMYGLLFGVVLKTSRGIDNFIGFVILGVSFFAVLTRLTGSAPGLVKNSKPLMQAFSFPRASIVFSQVIRLFLDCLPACAVAVVFALSLQWNRGLSWTVILVIPIYVLMIGFGAGLLFILSRVTAFVPDFKVIIDVMIRAWFFGSGVFFSIDRFVDHPVLLQIMTANPGYIFIDSVRAVVIRSEVPSAGLWLSMIGWALIPLLLGVYFFWRAENRYANV